MSPLNARTRERFAIDVLCTLLRTWNPANRSPRRDRHPGPVSPFETPTCSNNPPQKDQGVAMNAISPRTLAVREQPLPEPVIQCPHCQGDIKLTESLAAPFIRAREAEFKRQEAGLREREAALDAQIAERVATERKKVEEEAQRKARLALGTELESSKRELVEANELLKLRDQKLAEAQRAQAELIRKQREVEEQKREIELTVEKRVSAAVGEMRSKARQEVESELKLKVTEKDQVIQSMQRQIEELRRKAEQGSQQLQGEVQELELESLLGSAFVFDTITRVPKGEFGGDVLHRVVMNQTGAVCGTILWESKRTKTWSDGWRRTSRP